MTCLPRRSMGSTSSSASIVLPEASTPSIPTRTGCGSLMSAINSVSWEMSSALVIFVSNQRPTGHRVVLRTRSVRRTRVSPAGRVLPRCGFAHCQLQKIAPLTFGALAPSGANRVVPHYTLCKLFILVHLSSLLNQDSLKVQLLK